MPTRKFAGEFAGEIDEQLIDDLRLATMETIEYRRDSLASSLPNADSSEQSSLHVDEVAADPPKMWTIPEQHRLGPVQKKELLAAFKISYSTLKRRIESGSFRCDEVSRQSCYVDARQFSKDAVGHLQHQPSRGYK